MPDYKALCSDCPKCGKENIVFLAHKFRKIGVKDASMKRITCTHCFHAYEQRIEEMVLSEDRRGDQCHRRRRSAWLYLTFGLGPKPNQTVASLQG